MAVRVLVVDDAAFMRMMIKNSLSGNGYTNLIEAADGQLAFETYKAEKPDLVVFTGDVVFASPAKPAYDQALAPVIERNLPFAVVLGNHDIEFDLTGEQILEHLATKPGNLTSTTTGISGVTNYLLTVKHWHSICSTRIAIHKSPMP